MEIFKFGGASVATADRIKNLYKILQGFDRKDLIVVISAMGKTTNKLEKIVIAHQKGEDYAALIEQVKEDFFVEMRQLFDAKNEIFREVGQRFDAITSLLREYKNQSYNFIYDQVVPCGELISTHFISRYLNENGLMNTLLDARDLIITDATYRDANVDWTSTCKQVNRTANKGKFFITQGFIGGNKEGFTTTLGREGSDYTAAILAYCLDADELDIWKDVPGVLNADPRSFENTTLLQKVSFREAIELAYYGASIIHPKTIQPLHSKNIPLRVRSFLDANAEGTYVGSQERLVPNVPCYILKKEQQFLKVSSKDFSFIVENDISDIFKVLHEYQMKVNLLHNSAVSLSLCIDDRLGDIDACVKALQERYLVDLRDDVTLYTIRNYSHKDFKTRFPNVEPILRQSKDDVVHIILENGSN